MNNKYGKNKIINTELPLSIVEWVEAYSIKTKITEREIVADAIFEYIYKHAKEIILANELCYSFSPTQTLKALDNIEP